MAILITGGTGLIGSEFKGDKYIKISSKAADLRDIDHVNLLFNVHKPNSVIHCAAKVGGVLNNMENKASFYYDNIMMNTNVIHAAYRHGVKKFVGFLSTCIFPDNIYYPLTEEKIHLGPPHFSNDAYAYAKRMMDIQIRAYNQQYGLNYTSVIPCNVFGPNDNYNIEYGHVIPSLIHKCYLAREKGEDLEVWGSGKPLREFIYSKDVSKLTEWIHDNYNDGGTVLLSTSIEISIADIVKMIAKIMNFSGKIKWNTNRPDGQLRKPSSNAKLLKLVPDFKFTPIEKALKETVDFFESNYNNIRK